LNQKFTFSPSEWIAQSEPIEDYVLHDMFEWLTSPARDVNEEGRTEDINYTVSFSENNKGDFLA
jgi:hypothetical protein